jgi:hypothetical protein
MNTLIPTDEEIAARNEELDARDGREKVSHTIDQQTEQARLLRSIRNYVAWAFWLSVVAAGIVLIATMAK